MTDSRPDRIERVEREVEKALTLLAERGPRRDKFEAEITERITQLDRRLASVEVLTKGTSESPMGKLGAIAKDPFAFLILMLVLSLAAKAGINPLDFLQ